MSFFVYLFILPPYCNPNIIATLIFIYKHKLLPSVRVSHYKNFLGIRGKIVTRIFFYLFHLLSSRLSPPVQSVFYSFFQSRHSFGSLSPTDSPHELLSCYPLSLFNVTYFSGLSLCALSRCLS